jgi:hypothetical protein
MKKLLLFLFAFAFGAAFFMQNANAQVSVLLNPSGYGYTFLNTTTTYTALTGGTVFQAGATLNTDANSSAISLPFVFTYNGIKENTIFINNNGYITFAIAQTTAGNTVPLSTTTTSGYDGAIAGLANNLVAAASGTPEIRYGTNAGGDFVVQYQDLAVNTYTSTRITFQIILMVDGKTIQIVYGPNNTGQASVSGSQVGLRGTCDEDWNNRALASGGDWNISGGAAGTTNTNTMTWTATSTLPTSGRTFQWSPTAYTPTYLVTPFTTCEEFTAWVNGAGPSNVPSTNWATNGYGNASWQIDNNPGTTTTTGWGSVGSYGYTPVDYVNAVGGHSARFHSGNTNSPQKGYLDYYVDFSSATGAVTLDFYQINTSGTDILQVFLSTDGGSTFTQVGSNIGVATTWTARSIALGAITSATSIIRFKATADYGSTDIGLDHVCFSVPLCPAPITVTVNQLTDITASVSWTGAASAVVEWGSLGCVPGTGAAAGACGNVLTAGASPQTITGLTPNVTYSVYVRQDCTGGGNGYSSNSSTSYFNAPTCPGGLGVNSVTVGSLPYSTAGQTTCGSGNNVTSTNIASVCGSTNYYGAEDRTYIFTPTVTGMHTILLTTATDDDAGIMLYQGCPFTAGSSCVANAQSITGLTRTLTPALTNGITYYLVVDNWPSPACIGTYSLTIDPPASCPAPTGGVSNNITTTTADLSWTSAGSLFNVKYNAGSNFDPNAAGTSVSPDPTSTSCQLSGLTSSTPYYWYVRRDCGGGDLSTWAGPYTFNTTLINDLCSGAITVTCGNSYPGTTTGATADSPGACNVPNYTYPGVWFHFVGLGDMVSVDLCGTSWDSQISVYQGTCGSLTCVDGNDDYCSLQSRVDWFAENGVDYNILVHQYGTTGGAFTITVNCIYPVTATWQGDDQYPSYIDWFGADNWDVADVPGSTTNVIIPTGLNYYPTVDRKGACNNISVASGARLVDQGTGYLIPNGAATVDQNYSGGEWHLISSPVTGATANMFLGLYLQKYTESTNAYTDISDPATPLNVMQGYALWNDLAGTASFVGALNTGAMGSGLTRNGLGLNLVGNPYISPIDWDAVTGWTKTNMDDATYRHVNNATWAEYVGGVGTNGGTRYIAPNQGFFVRVTSGFTLGTLGMTNDVRTHSTAPFFKDEIADIVRLEVSGNGYTNETVIRFLDLATPEFDGDWDAYKLFGIVPEAPAIYSAENDMMAINSLPATNTVPVGVKAGVPGEFTITATETSEFTDVILEDLFTGNITDLKSNFYTFNYDMNLDNRFIVHFVPLAVGENPDDLINIYSNQKDVYVSVPANTKGDIVVYNLMGQEVARTLITDVLNKITLEKSAYYVVKVMSNESVVTKKVFVK